MVRLEMVLVYVFSSKCGWFLAQFFIRSCENPVQQHILMYFNTFSSCKCLKPVRPALAGFPSPCFDRHCGVLLWKKADGNENWNKESNWLKRRFSSRGNTQTGKMETEMPDKLWRSKHRTHVTSVYVDAVFTVYPECLWIASSMADTRWTD